MHCGGIKFSIVSHAAWAPGIETEAAWRAWANNEIAITGNAEPSVKAMSPLLRRRASVPGKMALEVAYRCLGERTHIPIIFCSRHGECGRSADLLFDLARDIPLSPASFSLSVHNATAGLFSIARHDHASSLALAAGSSTIEHAVIEACSLLADGEPAVLLVAYDGLLPTLFTAFQDCYEQPYAWAWLMQPAAEDNAISLNWSAVQDSASSSPNSESAGLEILRFFIRRNSNLERISNGRRWQWAHQHA
jgi:hypothetical protein